MDNEQRNRFDALETLRQSAWNNFDKRREIEWKVCLSLWAALGLFIGAILTRKEDFVSVNLSMILVTSVIMVFAVAVHIVWIAGLYKAHNADKAIINFFRDQMMKELSVHFPEKLKDKLDQIDKRNDKLEGKLLEMVYRFPGKFWYHLIQGAITLLLASIAIISLLATSKINMPNPR